SYNEEPSCYTDVNSLFADDYPFKNDRNICQMSEYSIESGSSDFRSGKGKERRRVEHISRHKGSNGRHSYSDDNIVDDGRRRVELEIKRDRRHSSDIAKRSDKKEGKKVITTRKNHFKRNSDEGAEQECDPDDNSKEPTEETAKEEDLGLRPEKPSFRRNQDLKEEKEKGKHYHHHRHHRAYHHRHYNKSLFPWPFKTNTNDGPDKIPDDKTVTLVDNTTSVSRVLLDPYKAPEAIPENQGDQNARTSIETEDGMRDRRLSSGISVENNFDDIEGSTCRLCGRGLLRKKFTWTGSAGLYELRCFANLNSVTR
ncbi:unnamed protein product, partial [Allacma fusca]